MKFKYALLGGLALVASSASFAGTIDTGAFTVGFSDEFGIPKVTPGVGTFSIAWSHATDAVLSPTAEGTSPVPVFLPTFTVSTGAGFQLSGPVSGSIGPLFYSDAVGNETSVTLVNAFVAIDGGSPIAISDFALLKTPSAEGASFGSFSFDMSAPVGNFSSYTLGGVLALAANGFGTPGFNSVLTFPASYSVTFNVTPIPTPVPASVWLMSSGLAAVALRRRRKTS